ncbi:MAG TPA: hypothetical protein VG777_08015, partial [Thermoanaerobaculia bacterium]|nr:hypothetical protein [Thermoanaerobaculia bacterium]
QDAARDSMPGASGPQRNAEIVRNALAPERVRAARGNLLRRRDSTMAPHRHHRADLHLTPRRSERR